MAKGVDTHIDILTMTETFQHRNMDDFYFSPDDFNFYLADRKGIDGGGVDVFVRDDFAVKILAVSDPLFHNKSGYLILKITTSETKILFAAIYRRPPADYP